jgi:hypothetical protein
MLYEHWIKLFLIFRMFTLIIFLVGNCQFYFNNDSNTLLLINLKINNCGIQNNNIKKEIA